MPEKKPSAHEPKYAVPRPTQDQFVATRERVNRVSADFLKLDVETALTFSSNALGTEDRIKKERNRKAARKAYDTVLRLAKKVELTDSEAQTLSRGLKKLKADLLALGEAV